MKRVWMAAALAPLAVLVAAAGCGNECGTGTEMVDGECIGIAPDASGPTRCGPGTIENEDGDCIEDPDLMLPDGGGGDVIVPDGSTCPGAEMCGEGLVFVEKTCTCEVMVEGLPAAVPMKEIDPRVIPDALGGSFATEADGVYVYWTSTAAGDDFGVMRQKFNTKTLALEGEAEPVTEIGPRAFTPAISHDGLWMIWGCNRADQTDVVGPATRKVTDLCIANRAAKGDAWGNIRVMDEIAIAGGLGITIARDMGSSSPTFVPGPDGAPVAIYFSANNPVPEGGSNDICTATFDASTGLADLNVGSSTSCDDGNGKPDPSLCPGFGTPAAEFCVERTLTCKYRVCGALQFNDGIDPQPGDLFVSELHTIELGPSFSADGSTFIWTKAGEGTDGVTDSMDLWIGDASNGQVTKFLGRLETGGTIGNQLEADIAPDGSNAVVWTEIDDLTDLSAGSFLSFGRLSK